MEIGNLVTANQSFGKKMGKKRIDPRVSKKLFELSGGMNQESPRDLIG